MNSPLPLQDLLCVDDSAVLRRFVEKSADDLSWARHVNLAEDGRRALELAVATPPGIILLEHNMPDMTAAEFCAALDKHPHITAPIIITGPEGTALREAVAAHPRIVQTLVKPFSRELLIATLTYALRRQDAMQREKRSAQESHHLLLRGTTASYPLSAALRAVEQQRLTGEFRVNLDKDWIVAWCREGFIRLVTTRNINLYLEDTPFAKSARPSSWDHARQEQATYFTPLPFTLETLGILPRQTSAALADVYGHRLFARLWNAGTVSFEFAAGSIPDVCERALASLPTMDDWILRNLKFTDCSNQMQEMLADLRGVPAFTREGLDQLALVHPDRDDGKLLSLINGATSFFDICRRLRVPPARAARRLVCYRRLGLIDFWPSCMLQSNS